jgi:hypothetical protein
VRLGYLCFGCSNPVDAPLKNRYWCQNCLTINLYSGTKKDGFTFEEWEAQRADEEADRLAKETQKKYDNAVQEELDNLRFVYDY